MQATVFTWGQPRRVGKVTHYDVWSLHRVPGTTTFSMGIGTIRYTIDTAIHPDNSLEASASVEFRASLGSQQFSAVQLSRALKISAVTGTEAEALPFFQNECLTQQEINSPSHASLIVILPNPPA